jgi:hypothetical protein
VIGYYIEARDGDIGHVEDLLVDEHDWAIRYIVVDTRNWLPGRKVVIATGWLERVEWATTHQIVVDLTRDQIRNSPEYDPSQNWTAAIRSTSTATTGDRRTGPDGHRLAGCDHRFPDVGRSALGLASEGDPAYAARRHSGGSL